MMKNFKLLTAGLFFLFYIHASAQLLVDHPIILNGGGTNAKVSGIKNVSDNQDATSVDYIQRDSLQFAIASPADSNNSYTVNLSPPIELQYSVGMIVHFKAGFSNTAPATLSVNSLARDTIKKNFNNNLDAYDIQNGQMVSVIFDGVYFQMLSQLVNKAGPHGKQLFKNSGTFNVPLGITRVWVSMSGGGGGGSYGSSGGSGGGGADAIMDSVVTVYSSSYTITIGAGGLAGTSANHNGGNTSFGNLIITNGGNGGTSSGGGQAGGTGGVNGLIGNCCASQAGGPGGGSLFGCGGGGAVYTQDGGNGSGYGAGGGGGDSAYGSNGGSGSPGFVLIEW